MRDEDLTSVPSHSLVSRVPSFVATKRWLPRVYTLQPIQSHQSASKHCPDRRGRISRLNILARGEDTKGHEIPGHDPPTLTRTRHVVELSPEVKLKGPLLGPTGRDCEEKQVSLGGLHSFEWDEKRTRDEMASGGIRAKWRAYPANYRRGISLPNHPRDSSMGGNTRTRPDYPGQDHLRLKIANRKAAVSLQNERRRRKEKRKKK